MGKSFLLDLFLRYLSCTEGERERGEWVHRERPLEGHCAVDCDVAGADSGGFSWRGGSQRMTTGCWIWSEPFILPVPGGAPGEKMALLILDTQGMFDGETSQKLTATIFGLTTMLSSTLIYNVSKQIQEDNLQHLQLFLEYGRLAHDAADTAAARASASAGTGEEPPPAELDAAAPPPPFQHLQFLVRDWQNFDYEEQDASDARIAARIEAMEAYFSEVSLL